MRKGVTESVFLAAALAAAAGLVWLGLRAGATRPAMPGGPGAALAARESGTGTGTGTKPAPEPAPVSTAPADAAARRSASTQRNPVAPVPVPVPENRAGGAAAPPGPATLPLDLSNDEILRRAAAGEPGFEVLASRIDLGTAAVTPQWREGEVFLVSTFYRQMQAPREVWSGPATWRFEIEGEVAFRDRPCWRFVVTRVDDPALPPATYYVTRGGYRLAGVETTVAERGKRRTVTYIPSDEDAAGLARGVKAPLSIVPFDLPPVGAHAKVTPAGIDDAPPLEEGAGRERMPRPDTLVGAGAPALDLAYENPIDRTTVRQRWSREDLRWPVVSKTETTWSFRVK